MKEKERLFLQKNQLFVFGWYLFFPLFIGILFFFSSHSFDDIPSMTYFIYPVFWKALLLYFYGIYGMFGFFVAHVVTLFSFGLALYRRANPRLIFYWHPYIFPFFSSIFAFMMKKDFYCFGMLGEIAGEVFCQYFLKSAPFYFFLFVFFYFIFLIGVRRSFYFFSSCFGFFYRLIILKFFLIVKRYAIDWIFLCFPFIKKYMKSSFGRKNNIEEAVYRSIYSDFYNTAHVYGISVDDQVKEKQTVPLCQRLKRDRGDSPRIYKEIVSQEEQSYIIDILRHFEIQGDIIASFVGPLVKTIVFTPLIQIRLQKIFLQVKDIGRASGHPDLRISYPVKDFPSSVAIEYAKEKRDALDFFLYALDPDFCKQANPLEILIGVGTDGTPFLLSIKQAPHLLLAGTTGSGKSSLLHVCIANILCKHLSSQVQLVLIDPKKTEFEAYRSIPHLLLPVAMSIDDIEKAIESLLQIMYERYDLFQAKKCKNIDEYNMIYHPLSYILVIIDEYADIVMQAKHIENKILRILQLSRAAGIHIIIATQRPSADVINTTVKSNLPVRIGCKVASSVDSRIVLDVDGAEQLLGFGDMILFQNGKYTRLHGFFIDGHMLDFLLKDI
jgi:hypothetical protein